MAIDLARLYATGQRLVTQAIKTSGTRVRLYTETATTHPDTLVRTTSTTVLYEGPAVLTVQTLGGTGSDEAVPGIEVKPGDWKVLLLPAAPDVEPGTFVSVVKCRSRQMVDRSAKVTAAPRDGSGALLTVFARPKDPS